MPIAIHLCFSYLQHAGCEIGNNSISVRYQDVISPKVIRETEHQRQNIKSSQTPACKRKSQKKKRRRKKEEKGEEKKNDKQTGNGACAVIRNVDVSAIASRHVLTYTPPTPLLTSGRERLTRARLLGSRVQPLHIEVLTPPTHTSSLLGPPPTSPRSPEARLALR